MGTNYYGYEEQDGEPFPIRVHIGKRSFAGKNAAGEGKMHFTWAVGSDRISAMTLFRNEYGDEFSPYHMYDLITGCEDHDYTFIGREFS